VTTSTFEVSQGSSSRTLLLELSGCGSSGPVVCNASSGGSCPNPGMGPEILYGFPAAVLLNTSMTATINPNTGGLSSVSIETVPFFGSGVAAAPNAQFLYASAGTQIFGYSIGQTNGTLTRLRDHPSHFHRTPLFRVWRQRRIACSSMSRVDPIAFMTECEKLESSRRRPSNNSRMNAVLTSTRDIRRPVDRALPPTLTVYRTSFHGGLKVLPRTPRGSRQPPASNVVMLSLFALPFWLEDLSESQAASFRELPPPSSSYLGRSARRRESKQ
jgi:hypothetical protein